MGISPGDELAHDAVTTVLTRLPGLLRRCDQEIAEARAKGWHDVAAEWRETRSVVAGMGDDALELFGRIRSTFPAER